MALPYASPDAITSGKTFDWRTTFAFASITAIVYGIRWKLYQYFVSAIVVIPLISLTFKCWRAPIKGSVEERLLIIGLSSMFFATELSIPFWFNIKSLQMIQFSYRFLAPASVAGLLGCAWCLRRTKRGETPVWIAIAATAVFLFGMQLKLFAEGQNIFFEGDLGRRLYSDQNMLPAVHGLDWLSYGKSGGFNNECKRLNLQCNILDNWPESRRWRIIVQERNSEFVKIRLPAFAYPTWTVVVNGSIQSRLVDPATGAIIATLEELDNLVELRWTPLIEERIGWAISSLSALFLVLLQIKVSLENWKL